MAWWQTMGCRRPVYVIEAQRAGSTIALSCLVRSRLGVGAAAFELLTPVGQDPADAGRLTMGDLDAGGGALLDAIGELCGRRMRVLNIPRLRDDGAEHALVTSHDWSPRLRLTEETRSVCPVLVYDGLTEPAAHVAATAKRRSVPRLRRRLAELGDVTIELRAPVAEGFDELLAVYDARWTDRSDEQGLFAACAHVTSSGRPLRRSSAEMHFGCRSCVSTGDPSPDAWVMSSAGGTSTTSRPSTRSTPGSSRATSSSRSWPPSTSRSGCVSSTSAEEPRSTRTAGRRRATTWCRTRCLPSEGRTASLAACGTPAWRWRSGGSAAAVGPADAARRAPRRLTPR